MTPLVRKDLRDALRAADSAHPGLLLQRGWTDHVEANSQDEGAIAKAGHISRICVIPYDPIYGRAFLRWLDATGDAARFRHAAMKIEGRLLIGLAGGGALETGCAVSQTWGMPYLPGSSIKGVVRAYAEQVLGPDSVTVRDMFGIEADEIDPAGLSSLVTFHDAWWIPGSGPAGAKDRPFAAEVVTPHHSDYFGNEGAVHATDLDSPVPNALVGVQGAFLFTLEGPAPWLDPARELLQQALARDGIGAKTRAGYGYLVIPGEDPLQPLLKKNEAKSAEQNFCKAKLHRNPATGEIKAILDGNRTTAPLKQATAQVLLNGLPEEQRNGKKIREGKLNVEVRVRIEGNMLTLVDLRPAADTG